MTQGFASRSAAISLRALAAIGLVGLASSVHAQSIPVPKPIDMSDQNGVDLTTNTMTISFPLATFGDGVRLSAFFNLNQPHLESVANSTFMEIATSQIGIGVDFLSGGGSQAGYNGSVNGMNTSGTITPVGSGTWYTYTGWYHWNSNGTAYPKSLSV